MVDKSQETTHFGFQTVAKEQKADMVAHVFHSVASKYDVMNDLMSFGIHRLWKRFTIDCSGVRRGQTVLDLAGGTGDLTAKFSPPGRRKLAKWSLLISMNPCSKWAARSCVISV
ncbi:ubiquinone/menaquinone biosynthesis methyltransferase [Escherichia coli]|nr:ubiquinone/menaquinone biosynthesis methyltransferase [Escherichia coli]